MRINKFIVNFILAAAPMAASHMVYLKDTATGLGTQQAVTADNQGNAFVAGTISGGATGTNLIGPRGGISDVKVVKLSQTGQVLWTTIIGGSGIDKATSIAVAPNGQIFLAIESDSSDFPLAANNSGKAIVASLNANGAALGFATRIAGAGAPLRIFVDAQLNSYIGGNTLNADFVQVGVANPPTPSAPDGYIARLSNTGAVVLSKIVALSGTMLDFAGGPAGYWGVLSGHLVSIDSFGEGGNTGAGSGNIARVAMDSAGFAYTAEILQTTVFVRKWTTGFGTVYHTPTSVPTSGGGIDDIAVNAAGEVHLTVRTTNVNGLQINPIPGVTPQSSDNMLAKLDANGSGNLLLSTYVGIPVGSQAKNLFVNAKGIFFAVNGTHAARVMEKAADMSVSGISRVKNGNISTMTVRVFNNGPNSVTSSGFQASIPGTPQAVTTSQGQCSISGLGIVSCGFGALASGALVNVTMSTIPPSSGNLDPTPMAGSNTPDPNSANDAISFPFLP